MRVALGQFNACVGDFAQNAEKMRKMYAEAIRKEADLIIFPELAVCGYPPEDLLHKRHFLEENHTVLAKLAADCPDKVMVVGFAEVSGANSYNSAAVIQDGKVTKLYRK